jgi:succinoglycan biosynthesis protein ExoA
LDMIKKPGFPGFFCYHGAMEVKTVSIIIPVKPGGTVKALDALRDMDYPSEAVEIIVAEGRCPSRQRNTAACAAKGEILYFLDDDSMTSPMFLVKASGHYGDRSVAAVGGPSLTPVSDPPLRQAFALALSSRFGSGSVRNRYRKTGSVRETADNELILCNLSMRSDVFLSFGGFDERLYPNEENELMVRIRKNGLKLVHDPDLSVYRGQRKTFPAFVRQIFGYGRGRGRQTLISGISSFASFVPVVFLLYLLSLPLVDKPVYYLPLLCYLVMDFFYAARESAGAGKTPLAPLLCCLFPVLHISYGAGIIWEFLSYGFRNNVAYSDNPVTLRRVKEFGQDPV